MVLPVDWLFSVMPLGISEHANKLDYLYWFLIITCGILFLLLIIPLVLIIIRYRRKNPNQRALSQKDHNFWLESIWTFLPFIYLTILFVWGFEQFIDIYVAPHDAKELRVIGQKWQWTVDYPEEEISVSGANPIIAVPVGKPIKLVMSSQDVIHSFYIPNARIKQDVLPGRYSTIWFRPDQVGKYPVFCAEYCGTNHSLMGAVFDVKPALAYSEWVEEQKKGNEEIPLPELGKKLYDKLGCAACHSMDGSPRLAPSFKDIFNKKEDLSDGSSVVIDENYIRQKILDPTKRPPAKGFAPIMPTFQGRVSERDISGIIAFIKSLS